MAIFIILIKFNNQEQPKWSYASTLNLSTLIALTATVLRAMLQIVLDAGEYSFSSRDCLNHPEPHHVCMCSRIAERSIHRYRPAEMALVPIVLAPA